MLRLLLLFLVGLSFVQSNVVAPAVSTTTACICPVPVPVPIATPICVRNLDTTSHPSSTICDNLNNCRTLLSIVQSCVVTIFACVWVAVHRNIPGPQQSWISIHLEWLKVVVLAVLVPEWVLAWAVRQGLRARTIVKQLEDARAIAQKAREKRQVPESETEGDARSVSGNGEGPESEIEHKGGIDEDKAPLIDHHNSPTEINDAGQASEVPDTWTTEANLGRTNEPWTTTHAFFVIMGGFHYYQNGQPLHPLSSKDVIDLVKRGALVPPTSNELHDKSKGDALSKGVAIVQTLWFVMQCIARRIEHLPMTSLEVMTLAYTVITVAMYTAWWNKPLNISCAVRVPGTAVQPNNADPESTSMRVFDYVMGDQDELVTLSQEQRVPTFWADCEKSEEDAYVPIADIIALLVTMAFGAVHCIAWSDPYAFPSPMEQLMWRISAITIVAVPVGMLLGLGVCFLIALLSHTLGRILGVVCLISCAIGYIAARLILLSLSFATLRSLPFAAYQTVQWTAFIPHI